MTADGHRCDAILRLGPAFAAGPVLLAVPHAGRDYPPPLRARAAVALDRLVALEDRHAELLVADAIAAGASALVATRARCWIDLNRDEREIDPDMIDPPPPSHAVIATAKVRGGLGLIPRRLPGGADIVRGRILAEDAAARIAADHRPWHAAIAEGLAERRTLFGAAVLLDCHSMPPIRPMGGISAPRIVIGDLYGRSASDRLIERLVAIAAATGLKVARNAPYAGGHTLNRHGRPGIGVHAVQIEIDRSLYLAADLRSPGQGLPAMRALIARMAQAAAEAFGDPRLPLAAE